MLPVEESPLPENDATQSEDVPPGGESAADLAAMRSMFGPDVTFLGVPRADKRDSAELAAADAVIIGAPFDSGTSYRSGARFGPNAIRLGDSQPHIPRRPHLGLGLDPFEELRVVDAGDVLMPPGHIEQSHANLREVVGRTVRSGAIPIVLGGDHSIALPDVSGVADCLGFGAVGVIHFDAHPDTWNTEFGSLYGHGTPMRRLLESGAVRGDHFVQIGIRGYWPDLRLQEWMRGQGMRWFDMAAVNERGLDRCLTAAFDMVLDRCDAVFLSIDIDVVDPAFAPGTGTPEVGGLTSTQLLDAVRRCALELPVVGAEVVEVSPPYDLRSEITAFLANRVVLEMLVGIAARRRQATSRARAITEPDAHGPER